MPDYALLMAAALAAQPVLPDWMAGCWTEAGERWTDECWMSPRAGIMLGASRSGAGETLREWEMLNIVLTPPEREGAPPAMAYRAAQQGGGFVSFVWRSDGAPGVTFVNPAHDYPQRIRYWREGVMLKAEIAMLDGSRPLRWNYLPARR